MRILAIVVWLALAGLMAPAAAQSAGERQRLAGLADDLGLRDRDAFVAAIASLRHDGRLPSRYVQKAEARAHGWRGGGLCEAWPGHAIGGDVFHDFAHRLPPAPHRVYREADLDATCRSRGPKRLIFSNDGLIYVTIDHYNRFVVVP